MRLPQLDDDVRPGGLEPAHHLGKDLRSDALEDPDVERAGLAGRKRGQVCLGRLETRDDRGCVAEQQPAGLGHRDGPRAARALDQLLADDPLERRDLLAHRRLRVAELDRGAPEGAFGLDGIEGGQMAELDSEPVVELGGGACCIAFANGHES